MIENVHCRKDCPNRAEGCHTTCADGAAEMLVNSIVRDEISKRRRAELGNASGVFELLMKRIHRRAGQR